MRILHTSDWHLGRTLHGVDLLDHQRAFLDHLVGVVTERRVDVVLVAGDVYDRAVPSVLTVSLLSEALERLSAVATVIVTSGNHDSAVRLGFAASVMRPGLHLLTSVDRLDQPVIVDDDFGPVAFYGLPYLDPDTVRGRLGGAGAGPAEAGPAEAGCAEGGRAEAGPVQDAPGQVPRSHEAVVGAALDRVRADLGRRDGTRSVVSAHVFVVGGAASESERDIRVGGVDAVPSALFHGFDYVALGHLHGAQAVGASVADSSSSGVHRGPVIRYSGSPLAFSFGEKDQVKSSALVELDAGGGVTVELVPTPVPRRLSEVTADLADLLGGRFDDLRDDWLRVFVTDPVHPEQIFARVGEHFPFVLSIQHTPVGGPVTSARRAITSESDPLEVAADFVAFATGGPATEAESAVLRTAYEAALAAETSA